MSDSFDWVSLVSDILYFVMQLWSALAGMFNW
jgi:hypothetical protein